MSTCLGWTLKEQTVPSQCVYLFLLWSHLSLASVSPLCHRRLLIPVFVWTLVCPHIANLCRLCKCRPCLSRSGLELIRTRCTKCRLLLFPTGDVWTRLRHHGRVSPEGDRWAAEEVPAGTGETAGWERETAGGRDRSHYSWLVRTTRARRRCFQSFCCLMSSFAGIRSCKRSVEIGLSRIRCKFLIKICSLCQNPVSLIHKILNCSDLTLVPCWKSLT